MEDLNYRTAIVRICSTGRAYIVIKYHDIVNGSRVYLTTDEGDFLDVDGSYDFGESLKYDADIIETVTWIGML
jgi:hypothetical protein